MSIPKKSVTVGYRYYMGIHFGTCHGPVDDIDQIQVGERLAWSGSQTTSGRINIAAPDLFGGESKEGGIAGGLDVMMGEPSQQPNDYLASKQGTPQPAYRGILGFVFRGGLIAVNNPYVKPWAFRVRRIKKGWHNNAVWYPDKAEIVVDGIKTANPAHIVFECLTNPIWGMGYPSNMIDAGISTNQSLRSSFQIAADQFYSEGFGLCIMWAQQDSLQNFVQLVLDHCGAVLSQDAGGGLFKLKALRDDYTPGALELFSDTNGKIITLEKIERTTYTENVNEIAINYTDATTGRNGSIFVQNLSNVQAQGAVVSQTRQYPGIPTANLAARVGMRDLKATTSGLARVTFIANRSAFALVPGDVIRFQWAPSGISSMSLRITRMDYGPLQSGQIRVEGIEDVFGLPATVYSEPQPISWTPPDYAPAAASYTELVEVPYRELWGALDESQIAVMQPDDCYTFAVATRPATSLAWNYLLQTKAGSGSYTDREFGDWAPAGFLADTIQKTTTAIILTSTLDIGALEIGTLAFIGTGTNAEIVQFTAATVDPNSGVTTYTIKRGCVDTVPKVWPAGTRVTSYERHGLSDGVQYLTGEVVTARFITKTGSGSLPEADAPTASITIAQRAARPYPPGLLQFNGLLWPSAATEVVAMTWAHRDRTTQQDQVYDFTRASVGPEPGTTYRVTVKDADQDITIVNQASITGDTYTLQGYGAQCQMSFELESFRDGLASWQKHTHTLSYTPLPLLWTPADMTGIKAWFDGADQSTLTLSGNNVLQWNDKSATQIHASSIGTTRVTRQFAGQNGRPILNFPGNAALGLGLSSSGLFYGVNQAAARNLFNNKTQGSILCVYRMNPANTSLTGRILMGWGGSTSLTNRFVARANDNLLNAPALWSRRLDAEAEAKLTGTTNRADGWVILVLTIDWASGDAFMHENGSLTIQSLTFTTSGATSATDSRWVSIGGAWNTATVAEGFFRGSLAEIVVSDSLWSEADRQKLEGYAAHKWGLLASLPAGHPYKVNQPTP